MALRIALLLMAGALARAQLLSPVWVELGQDGQAIARVVVTASEDCPSIRIGGETRKMSVREPVPQGFRPVCEMVIPAGAKNVRVDGRALPLPQRNPSRIVVLGDTGCRIKGKRLQDCNDPAQWPFARVAAAAASASPRLVLDVGDYLYREDPCPADAQAQCGGTPSGDNWNAWNADFFQPAAKLLEAAPWVFARGNHEDCQRSWRGFFYYLDPRPWSGACVDASPPYVIKVGKFETAVFDSSSTEENRVNPAQLATFSSQLAGLHLDNAWLLDHHPFWAVRPGARGKPPTAQTMVLQEAWDKAAPQGINMVLSGHIHLFEVLSFGQGRPLQIVAGDGGTNLAQPVPEKVNGMEIHGIMVGASESKQEFGYTLLTRRGSGWDLELKNPQGGTRVTCRITLPDAARAATCEGGSPR